MEVLGLLFLWGVYRLCAVLLAAHINVAVARVEKIAGCGQHDDNENGDCFVAHG